MINSGIGKKKMKLKTFIKNKLFKGGKVSTENKNDSDILGSKIPKFTVIQDAPEPKKVTVKINYIPGYSTHLCLDKENGKEVVMLDRDENYVKKVFTEYEKVQAILKQYFEAE